MLVQGINMNNKKCYSCGKEFKLVTDLQRHKNRKTPCLIREISPSDRHNPLRCIFCNKIFSNKSNLRKHLGICKIKNGGMEILDEKVRYEQEIRILKEKDQQKDEQIKLLFDEINKLKNSTSSQAAELQIISDQTTTNNTIKIPKTTKNATKSTTKNTTKNTTNHTTNNTTNNTINQNINQNVVINFYNYDNPKIDTLHITHDDLRCDNLNKKLIELIYFNKLIPENHVLYRPNLKEQRLLIFTGDSWKNITGEALAPIFVNIKNAAYLVGHDKINGGAIYVTDDDFLKLPPAVQSIIKNFNMGDQIADLAIMEIITENREIVKITRAHGTAVSGSAPTAPTD